LLQFILKRSSLHYHIDWVIWHNFCQSKCQTHGSQLSVAKQLSNSLVNPAFIFLLWEIICKYLGYSITQFFNPTLTHECTYSFVYILNKKGRRIFFYFVVWSAKSLPLHSVCDNCIIYYILCLTDFFFDTSHWFERIFNVCLFLLIIVENLWLTSG